MVVVVNLGARVKPSFWQRFKSGLFSRAQFLTGSAVFFLVTSAVVYAFQNLTLHQFTSGQTISSQKVNENFANLESAIKKLNNKFIIGLSSDLSVTLPTTSGTWVYNSNIFNSIIFDATDYGYAQDLITDDGFIIQEDGLYEVTLLGKSYTTLACCSYPDLQVVRIYTANSSLTTSILSSTGLINSWTNDPGVGTMKSYLSSGDLVFVRAGTWNGGTTIAPFSLSSEKTKLIFEKID